MIGEFRVLVMLGGGCRFGEGGVGLLCGNGLGVGILYL